MATKTCVGSVALQGTAVCAAARESEHLEPALVVQAPLKRPQARVGLQTLLLLEAPLVLTLQLEVLRVAAEVLMNSARRRR